MRENTKDGLLASFAFLLLISADWIANTMATLIAAFFYNPL